MASKRKRSDTELSDAERIKMRILNEPTLLGKKETFST